MPLQFTADDNSVHNFPDNTSWPVVHKTMSRYNAWLSQGSSVQPDTQQSAGGSDTNTAQSALNFDGVCQMPDGSMHPYIDEGAGYVRVYGNGPQDLPGQTGLGVGAARAAMPTLTKRGGIAGGGLSGRVTSPASSAARALTGETRLGALRALTGTGSIGGSLARTLPVLGGILGYFDFMDHYNAPVCRVTLADAKPEESR